MVKTTEEDALAPLLPPRFLTTAETTHVDAHFEVSTDTTVYSGGSVDRLEKSITSDGRWILKSFP